MQGVLGGVMPTALWGWLDFHHLAIAQDRIFHKQFPDPVKSQRQVVYIAGIGTICSIIAPCRLISLTQRVLAMVEYRV